MSILHVLSNIDEFRITRDGHGVFGDEIRLSGWLLAHDGVERLEVVIDGHAFAVPHINLESRAVWDHHGGTFGERALNSRFRMVEKVPPGPMPLERASLRFASGGRPFEFGIEPPYRAPDAAPDAAAADIAALVMGFESIGDQCEFGLMQRRVGTERLGLFRYAGVGDALALARILANRFEGFAVGDDLEISTFGPEWIADVRSASINLHTGRIVGDISREQIAEQERTKLRFLAGKLLDDIEDGARVLVYRTLRHHRGGPDGTYGIDAIYDAIQAIGPTPLLWVNEADEAHPHATVEHLHGRLFRGWHRRLCPYQDAHSGDDEGWVSLLGAARARIDAVLGTPRHGG